MKQVGAACKSAEKQMRRKRAESLNHGSGSTSAKDFDRLVGVAVRTCRKAVGLSSHEVAAELGIGHGQLGMYERGQSTLTSGTLFKLAQMFEVSVDAFFPERHAEFQELGQIDPAEEQAIAGVYESIPDKVVRLRLLDLVVRLAEVSRHPEHAIPSNFAAKGGG